MPQPNSDEQKASELDLVNSQAENSKDKENPRKKRTALESLFGRDETNIAEAAKMNNIKQQETKLLAQQMAGNFAKMAAETIELKGRENLKKALSKSTLATSRLKDKRTFVPLNDDEPGAEENLENAKIETTVYGLSKMTEHSMSIVELVKHLNTHLDTIHPQNSRGLDRDQAASRLLDVGPNEIPKPKKRPRLYKFIESLTNLFNVLLFAAGSMYLFLFFIQPESNSESVWIGSTLFLVGFLNAGIEFYEQEKIIAILDSFKGLITVQTTTFRGGNRIVLSSTELVPGDIIALRSGDKVPADSIIFYNSEVRVDGSNLSGETEAFSRKVSLEGTPGNLDPMECSNVLFTSDVIVSGEAYAIVVQTGTNSAIGKISRLVRMVTPKSSSLTLEIRNFCRNISSLALITSFFFFFVALARGRNFTYAATFAIGILIAWVPQGLPLTVTMILAISGRRMADRNVLIKDLHGLETLGGITLLATDKTGTLTSNEMKIIEIWLNGSMWCVEPTPAVPEKKLLKLDVSGVAQLMHVCVTCSKYKSSHLGPDMIELMYQLTSVR